jgi:hypothetical protein
VRGVTRDMMIIMMMIIIIIIKHTNADSVNNFTRKWEYTISTGPIMVGKETWESVRSGIFAREIDVKLDKHRHDHAPKSVQTTHEDEVAILLNQQVLTMGRVA